MHYIFTRNKFLNFIFIFSILITFMIIFISPTIPELFTHAQKLEDISFRICLSLITSYVFYLIVVNTKIEKDHRNLTPYFNTLSSSIYDNYIYMFNVFLEKSKLDLDIENLTEEDMKNILTSVKFEQDAPLYSSKHNRKLTIREFLIFQLSKCKPDIERLLLLNSHLDSNLIQIIVNLEAHGIYRHHQAIVAFNFKDKDFSAFNDSFYNSYLECRKLRKYIDKN